MRTEMSLQLGLCGLFRSKSGWRMWPVSRDSFPVVFAISHCTVRTCALRRVLLGLCADGEGKDSLRPMQCLAGKRIFGREYSAQDAPVKRLTANWQMVLWRCMRLVAAASVQACRLMHRLWKHVCTKTKSISACADESRAPIKRLEPSEALGEPLLATSLQSGPSSAWDGTINTHRKATAAVAEKRLKRGLRRIYCDLDYTSKTVSPNPTQPYENGLQLHLLVTSAWVAIIAAVFPFVVCGHFAQMSGFLNCRGLRMAGANRCVWCLGLVLWSNGSLKVGRSLWLLS